MDKSGDNSGITVGAEVYYAAQYPTSIAGRYGVVIERYGDEVLVELNEGRVAWAMVEDLRPAYGAEL